jgi:transcriptional regulator with XRE-family HTH domain
MKIQPIGHFLKALRAERKKTLEFVARRIGATSSYISQLENGIRNPSDSSVLDILTKAYGMEESAAENVLRSWRIKQYSSKEILDMEKGAQKTILPFYKEINESVDATPPTEMRSFYLDPTMKISDYFLWEMNDNSMEPLIPQGALLLLSKDISDIPYHGIVLTKTEGNLTVRYYEKQPDRTKLIAGNSNFPVFFGQDLPLYGGVIQILANI